MSQITTAVAPSATSRAVATKKDIKSLLEGDQFKRAVAQSLPKHLPPDRFVRVALTAMTRTPKLAQCDQGTFFQCLLTLSQLGLEPDNRRAYLIPFENRKRGVTECQLIVGYTGLVDLARRSGEVSFIHADIVCENDEFEYNRGELKKHQIDFRKGRGEMYAAYALCRFKDGTEQCCVMSKDEIDGIRARSRAAQSGPWCTDYGEMAKKTAFRRLSKWLPLSPEYRDALDHDADALEDDRFQSAKPVFGAVVETKPAFELPPASEDGDLGPQPQPAAPEKKPEPPPTTTPKQQNPPPAPATPKPEPEPQPEPESDAQPDPEPESDGESDEQRTIRQLVEGCAANGLDELKFSVWLAKKYHMSPSDSIRELVETSPMKMFKVWRDREKLFNEAKEAIGG